MSNRWLFKESLFKNLIDVFDYDCFKKNNGMINGHEISHYFIYKDELPQLIENDISYSIDYMCYDKKDMESVFNVIDKYSNKKIRYHDSVLIILVEINVNNIKKEIMIFSKTSRMHTKLINMINNNK